MILLDTSVLSALMRQPPDAVVVEWLARQPADSVWLSSFTAFETRFAAAAAGLLAAERQKTGRSVDVRDTLIAGITVARRTTIATRNTKHFEGLDVPVIDPWSARA